MDAALTLGIKLGLNQRSMLSSKIFKFGGTYIQARISREHLAVVIATKNETFIDKNLSETSYGGSNGAFLRIFNTKCKFQKGNSFLILALKSQTL